LPLAARNADRRLGERYPLASLAHLLSTLYDYLTAIGADTAGIVVTVHGRRIELDLGSLRGRPETATH